MVATSTEGLDAEPAHRPLMNRLAVAARCNAPARRTHRRPKSIISAAESIVLGIILSFIGASTSYWWVEFKRPAVGNARNDNADQDVGSAYIAPDGRVVWPAHRPAAGRAVPGELSVAGVHASAFVIEGIHQLWKQTSRRTCEVL
jgi:hypothetical protein